MANKARVKQPKNQTNITVGGNVAGNIVVGDNNTITNVLPAAQPASLHQLPSPPADFVGREDALEKILQRERATISGVSGMGGVGKTALGLVAAHKLAEKYSDAQFFLDLRGVSQDPLTPQDAMQHVILSFDPLTDLRSYNDEQLRGLYLSRLTGKHTLLFLDNARDAAQVRSILPPAGNAVLITSRTHFSLEGMGEPLRLNVLPDKEAQELLTEICPRLGDIAPQLAQLCSYLPLALRIAATFLAENLDWTATDYMERLEKKRLKMLKTEGDPQQDVEAVFELSYTLLNEEEQTRWRFLSVFTAPFSREALTAICDLDDDAARDFVGRVQRISLLEYDVQTKRYFIHDLLREFGMARLSIQEDIATHKKHAEFFARIIEKAETIYRQGNEMAMQGLNLFDSELIHIQTGQAWSSAYADENDEIAKISSAYARQTWIISLRLHAREYARWLQAGLSAAQKLKDKPAQGAHLDNLGSAYLDLGNLHSAILCFKFSLSIAKETGNKRSEGVILNNMGGAHMQQDMPNIAIEYLEQALEINREVGNKYAEGNSLCGLGVVYTHLGETERAIELIKQALFIAHESGYRHSEEEFLRFLGNAYQDLDDLHSAIDCYEQTLAISHEISDKRGEGNALYNLGLTYRNNGDSPRAREFGQKALEVFLGIENPKAEDVRKWLEELG